MEKTLIYGVIGYPVGQSGSPAIHNAWFRERGIDARYEKFSIKPEDLGDFMSKFRREMSGASVTIPHKITIMKYLDEIDETARAIGAVNTIINRDGRLTGYNFDVDGAMRALEEVTEIKDKKVILLGTGGAARALAFGLTRSGAALRQLSRGDLPRIAAIFEEENTDIVINATPVGMEGGPEPNTSLVPPDLLKPHMIVFDIVYKPPKTKLLQDAEKAGCRVVTGHKMLLYQAEKQFELWTK